MATHRAIPGANLPQGDAMPGRATPLGGEVGRDRGTGLGNTPPQQSAASGQDTRDSGAGQSTDSGASESTTAREFPRPVGVMDRVKQQASTRVNAQINEQKGRAADGLGSVAAAIREASEHLRAENQTLATYADKAVDQIQHFADRMRDKDPAEMMRNLEQFARRNPTAFVGGAFVLGLGLARFLKSSDTGARARYDEDRGEGAFASRSLAGGTGIASPTGRDSGAVPGADDLSRRPGMTVDPAPGITS